MQPMETGVLIVGSGVAGGLMAETLLAQGKGPVTALEAGPVVHMRDRRTWLDYVMAGRLPYDHLGDQPADFTGEGAQPWNIKGGRLFARGGSTLHWGGWCPRMKPEDFELASRVGKGGLDWPFAYADLAPYYRRAEAWLQVAGDSADMDPPRKGAYPFEAPAYTKTDGVLIRTLEKLDIRYGHMPISRNGATANGMPACMTTGTCAYCPIGGRFTGDQPMDRLARDKRFTLMTGSAVTRLLCDQKRRIEGVEYLDLKTGQTRQLKAETVILCAGALEIPKLLLASSNRHWPQGIGNESDQVGRHLVANPYFYARASKQDNPERLAEEAHFPTLASRHWDVPAFQREGKFLMNRAESPLVKLGELMGSDQSPSQIKATLTGQHVVELAGTMQTFSYAENRVMPANGTTRFGLPRTRIVTPVETVSAAQKATNLARMTHILKTMGYSVLPGGAGQGAYHQRGDHAMCTTRMSRSPEAGVVDEQLKVHGTDNLFIVSNSVFPSGSPANPTLTLVALAMRCLERM